ncbi:hypothetical protein [Neisseria weaveri]|uniref:hypothetical protein n=1 Tax=Neisseria weaveri TaxID=28091 RepID=UPI0007C9C9D4|nr:hypothetical protein [Neisseria weaveri]SAY51892.1 Uncharacterised protein [Neisseria weaveri]
MSQIYSTDYQLEELQNILTGYLKIPFAADSVPGSLMEHILGKVRHAEVLNTYDFIDVYDPNNRIGWQVKATKDTTPITWKRAKIPNENILIGNSRNNELSESSRNIALQELGDAIIKFCNAHIQHSISTYNLDEVGYSRLIVKPTELVYFEKLLCTKENPTLFNPSDFRWHWSAQKQAKSKEQLPALHGTHIATGMKWFAWHGLGENQLHFNGEKTWWEDDTHKITFPFPQNRLTQEGFFEVLSQLR